MTWPLMKDTVTFSDRLKLAQFILTSNRFSKGPATETFEKNWSRWLDPEGIMHSLFVTSGSTANTLLLSAAKKKYGWNEKTRILVPATTWTTTVSPIIQLGMQPVFVDITLDDYGIDNVWVKKHYKELGRIDAIFYPHLLGLSGDIEGLREIYPNALIFQDLCESHGVLERGSGQKSKRGTESWCLGSTFSFYYGHHMTTVEGGMVSTKDLELYNLMLQMRNHGMIRDLNTSLQFRILVENGESNNSMFFFNELGYNFRNTDINATLGLSQLSRLDRMIDKRRENFKNYMYSLYGETDIFYRPDAIQLEYNSSYAFPFVSKEIGNLYKLTRQLKENDIEYRPLIAGNLLRHPAYNNYFKGNVKYPNADLAHFQGLYIGNNHHIGKKDFSLLNYILEGIA